MLSRSTLLHLRIPFSWFLLPVFLWALANNSQVSGWNVFLVFLILHLLVYPASNGYNSYFDKDEKSIGGLKHPPKVDKSLYWTSLYLDVLALILAFSISFTFCLMVFVYGLVSKAYSHPSIRLKKRPWIGWFIAGFFQGFFTYYTCLAGFGAEWTPEKIFLDQQFYAALLSSCLLWGSYPMTQVYQHEEDAHRGDRTISLLLGIKGTFHFTAICFFLSGLGFVYFFHHYFGLREVGFFLGALIPILVYFSWWYFLVRKDASQADFSKTMTLNHISSLVFNLFFGLLYFLPG